MRRMSTGLQRAVVSVLVMVSSIWASSVSARVDSAEVPGNVVLITLDTTRADHLGAYGWSHARTPHLDALAARGTRFERCDTVAPITLPSHSSLLTGLLPPRHGVRDNATFVLPSEIQTITTRLRAAGFDTGAVVSAVVLARRHGLDQGFRLYDDDLGSGYTAGTVVGERQAEDTTLAAQRLLQQLKPPFFLWVHYFDPHEEYRPPTQFADAATGPHRRYDGEIAYMDAQVGALLDTLPERTHVAVVGDHGEMLGDHGELTHGLLLYQGARRVPLLLAGPDVPTGHVHSCLVRTTDVAPTLLQFAGVEIPAGLDGESLLPLLPSAASAVDDGVPECRDRLSYSESFLPFFAYQWYPLRTLSNGRFLFLQAPESSLYQLSTDPGEVRDLAAEQPAAVRLWQKRMRDVLAEMGEDLEGEMRPENVISDEQRSQLESLGYLGGGGGGAVAAELPDPRTMTDVAQQLHEAFERVQQGECEDVLRTLQTIVQRDAHNFPALSLAATCLRDGGRVEDALALFRRAAEVNPLSPNPVANIAGCLLLLGRQAEAEAEYRRALALDPTIAEAATNLARLLRQARRQPQALTVLTGALDAGSHDPRVYLERGLIYTELGRLEPALDDFREASRRQPTDVTSLENAARTAYHLRRSGEAASYYERLLLLEPRRLDLWKTLGAVYHFELGKREDALRCFRRALTLEIDPAERGQLEQLVAQLSG